MRIMGLDFGAATVGVAISDALLLTAQGIETIRREKELQLRKTYQRIEELVKEYEVERIVVGYPKHLYNTVGESAKKAEEFAEAIAQPDKTFEGILDPLEAAAEHERYVTSLINAIYHECYEARDYRTMKFLDWFVDEQMEEEDNADSMINRYKLFGSDPKGLYALDQEYAGRVYTAPSLVL